jgi:hypothetical protein
VLGEVFLDLDDRLDGVAGFAFAVALVEIEDRMNIAETLALSA